MNKLNIKVCPLCGGTYLKYVMTCTDFYASGKAFELYNCESCNFTFTQDFPTGKDIDSFYHSADYISHTDTKKGIVNSIYHWVRKYMLKKKVNLVIKESHRKAGKLLDIGTGTGYFAHAMTEKGWKTDAIEKNAEVRNIAEKKFGLKVKDEDSLNSLPARNYDVITLWHVMEHLENLNETWDRLHELLKEKGILIVAVPNRISYDANKYGASWAAYDVPRHLWHFTPATMQQFGAKHGFIMAAHYPMPFDAFYISMLSEKNKGHRFAFTRGMFSGTIAWLQTLLKKENSSSIIYVFRKKQYEKK